MAFPLTIQLSGWRIWGAVLLLATVAVGFLTFAVLNARGDGQPGIPIVSGAIALICGLGAAYYALLWRRYRVIFHSDAVDVVTAFRQRRVKKSEVTSWSSHKSDDVYAGAIELQVKDKKRGVVIPLGRVPDEVIAVWLGSIPNAEEELAAESLEALLADAQYGATRDIRYATLLREKRLAAGLSLPTLLLAGWILFWPTPYPVALTAGLLLPIVVFVAAILLQDRWDFAGAGAGDQKPSGALLTTVFPFVVLLRAILDYRIFDVPRLIMFGCAIAAIAWLVLYLLRTATRQLSLGQLGLGLLLAIYGYSLAAHLNVQLDSSTPSTYDVLVLKSEKDSDGRTLTLAPWGPFNGTYSAKVSAWLQEQAPAGSKVSVSLYRGFLGARWWQIGPPETGSGQ